MYVTCAAHHDVLSLFVSTPKTDVISFNAMLSSYHQCGHTLSALATFQGIYRHGVLPNRASFLIALSACNNHFYINDGHCLHYCVMLESMESCVAVATALLSMYGRCHSMDDAWDVFWKLLDRDIITWNAMIAACAQNSYFHKGLELFGLLCMEGFLPNRASFLTLLEICGNFLGVQEGKKAHSCLLFQSFFCEVAVGNALITMYNRCGRIGDFRRLFDSLVDLDVVSWTCMITSLVQHNSSIEGLQCFQQMLLEGVLPNQVTFVAIFSACATVMAIRDGIKMHALVMGCGSALPILIGNALINLYAKCNSVDMAHCMFACLPDRDVVSWNSVIGVSSQSSLYFFGQMLMEAFFPSRATLLAVITSLAMEIPSLAVAKYLHAYCVGAELAADVMVVTALVSMYVKFGYVEEAWTLMDSLTEQDVILYNAMIAAFAQNGHTEDALKLRNYLQMKGMMPDKGTFISILDACSNQATIFYGRQAHVFIKELRLQSDPMIGNALLSMYGKCGKLEDAQEFFDSITTRDVTSWNVMINASGQCGDFPNAVSKYEDMQMQGIIPDKFTFAGLFCAYGNRQALQEGSHLHARIVGNPFNEETVVLNALISMYGKCGDIINARRSFERISHPDAVSWNALIGACLRCGQDEEAFFLCQSMHNVRTDKVTIISVASAFASQSVLGEGWLLHACIIDMGLQSELSVCNALVYMYGKCGSLPDARHVFERMEVNDVISWNAIIAAYGQHGQASRAFLLLHRMQSKGLLPDMVTLVSVITACSHAGLVDEGYYFFVSLSAGYGIKSTVDHFNCMIDLLGRAGRLSELESMIKVMPMDPTAVSWMTLLGACNNHLDVERGVHAANRLLDLQPQECALFILLSNLHASAGMIQK
ncbi:hypothetical protein L7F22_045528 [Adiantum nelumboides]|nr:hypothetical protein [Adiantum nelumboides]